MATRTMNDGSELGENSTWGSMLAMAEAARVGERRRGGWSIHFVGRGRVANVGSCAGVRGVVRLGLELVSISVREITL
jgi:hypothetical protein